MQLKEIQVSITNVCSIGCPYCYKSKLEPTFLSEKNLDSIIKVAKENKIDTIRLTGGDIFEHPDLLEFLRKIKIANLNIVANVSIQRMKRFEEISSLIDYCLLSFQNPEQIFERQDQLINQIKENPKIKIMACMVFQGSLDLERIFEGIKEIGFEDFFFLRDVTGEKETYLQGLLDLSEKIVEWNSKEHKIKNPIKIANAFPLCLVSKDGSKYCDGGQNDDGNNFVYINENGDLKLNSYSSIIIANIAGVAPTEFEEKISKTIEEAAEPFRSDKICQECKIKDKCLGGIKAKEKISEDPLTKFRGKSPRDKYFFKLQQDLLQFLPETEFKGEYIPTYFRDSHFFMQYPSLENLKTENSTEDIIQKINETNKELSLYLHFPFCNSRCQFCSVKKYPNEYIESYINFMLEEIDRFSEVLQTKDIGHIYLGGGTPTLIGKENFQKIFDKLFSHIPKENVKEISIETFPKDFDKELFDYLSNYVTRISIGIQCFSDKLLEQFKRDSTVNDMKDFLDKIKDYNFIKSIDIIYGLYLDEEIEDYEKDLREILSYSPDNITYQPLHNNKKLQESDEIFFLDYAKKLDKLNNRGREILKEQGYLQYTSEDFHKIGKPKFQYQLNLLQSGNMLGLGVGTYSFIEDTYLLHRSKNSWKKFQLDKNLMMLHELSFKTRNLSLDLEEINKKYNLNYQTNFSDSIGYLKNKKLIELENNQIKVTPEGLNYVDLISQVLMLNNFDYKIK